MSMYKEHNRFDMPNASRGIRNKTKIQALNKNSGVDEAILFKVGLCCNMYKDSLILSLKSVLLESRSSCVSLCGL